MQKLPPDAVKLFAAETLLAFLFLGGMVFGGLFLAIIGVSLEEGNFTQTLFLTPFLFGFLFLLPSLLLVVFAWFWAKAVYDNFGYELGEDRIIIESGVIWKRSVYIPYEKIQNIDIVRSPLSRLFGLALLQIQTAGISGAALVEGRIPGLHLDDANALRNKIMEKMKPKV